MLQWLDSDTYEEEPLVVEGDFGEIQVLHNICETRDMNIDNDAVAQQVAHDRLQPENAPDRLYSFTVDPRHA